MDFSRAALATVAVLLAGGVALGVPAAVDVPGWPEVSSAPPDETARQFTGTDRLAPDVPVSKNATFERLTELVGVEADVERPPVRIREMNDSHRFDPSPFQRTMGLDTAPEQDLSVTGLTRDGVVYLAPGSASPAMVEQVLVHEYVHTLQLQRESPWGDRTGTDDPTTDTRTARKAVIEGGAIWVTDRYVDEYLPNATRVSTLRSDAWRRGPAALASVTGLYHFGNRYVAAQLDDPADPTAVYEEPPTTTEQVLHNETPASEQPAPLSLTVDPGPNTVADEDVRGELSTLVILRAELPLDRARRAAAGWGADRLATVRLEESAGDRGYVWAHRWDDPGHAEEFLDAVETFAANRSSDRPASVTIQRVSEETTVVFAGPPAFLEQGTATGTDGNVSVTISPHEASDTE